MIDFDKLIRHMPICGNILKIGINLKLWMKRSKFVKHTVNESQILNMKLKCVKDKIDSLQFYMSKRSDLDDGLKDLRTFSSKLLYFMKSGIQGCELEGLLIKDMLDDWTKNITNKIAPYPESIFIEECFEIQGMIRNLRSNEFPAKTPVKII